MQGGRAEDDGAQHPISLQWDESFDIGDDTGTPVAEDYRLPFPFTGRLAKLELNVERPQLSAAAQKQLEEAMRKRATDP